ncbi:MAG: hypothetical protein AAF725_15105 [Acidobacteriota bacterium]
MTAGDSFFDRSPEQTYFQSLEKVMIELRGAPLQLSPDDWQVSKDWFRGEVPLELVEETLREVVGRKLEAGKEVPARLRYYRRAVEKAWQRVEELTSPGRREQSALVDRARRLENLAASLGEAAWLGDIPRLLRGLASEHASDLEERIAGLDARMVDLARRSLDESEGREIAARVEQALSRFGERMGEDERQVTRRRLEIELIRRLRRLPVLSLFAPEALGGAAGSSEASSKPAP